MAANETILPFRNYLDISNLNQTSLDTSTQQQQQENMSMPMDLETSTSNSFIDIMQNQTCLDITACNTTITTCNVSCNNSSMDVSRIPINDITMGTTVRVAETTLMSDDDTKDITIGNNDNNNETYPTPEVPMQEISIASPRNQNNTTYSSVESLSAEIKEQTRRQAANKSVINEFEATNNYSIGINIMINSKEFLINRKTPLWSKIEIF